MPEGEARATVLPDGSFARLAALPALPAQRGISDAFSLEWCCREAGECDFELEHHMLAMTLGRPRRTAIRLNGGRTQQVTMRPGETRFLPAGTTAWVRWEAGETALLFLDPALVEAIGAAMPGPVVLRPWLQRRDPLLESLLHALKDEGEAATGAGRVYVEALVVALVGRLATLHRSDASALPPAREGLAPDILRAVLAHIDAHLDERVELTALARLAGLSAFHFARAFQRATGRPPHRHLLERRIERARQLLGVRDLSVADIAYAVGFSSQSHFTTTFGRLTGMTPTEFRRSL